MTMNELQERIERLERQHRRTKIVTLLIIILAVGTVMGVGQSVAPEQLKGEVFRGLPADGARIDPPPIQAEIRTTTLSLVDSSGNPRGVLSALGDGSVLALFDRNGKTRAELSAAGLNVSFTLYDPDGKVRAVIGSTNLVGSRIQGERSPASSLIFLDHAGRLLSRLP
jgi:hypothetical protein